MKILHYDNSLFLQTSFGRKFLGKIAKNKDGDEFFMTHIKDPERHLMKKYQGYCINLATLNVLMNRGITSILIPEDGKTGFRGFIGTVTQYLQGIMVVEDEDEQRCVPLVELTRIPLEKAKISSFLRQ
jgi:hypothetical protein